MPDYGADKVRVPRIVPECRSKFVDCRVNAVLGFEEAIAAPELLLNGFSTEQLPWILQQQDEQLHRNPFELDGMPGPPQFAALDIQLEFLKSYGWLGHRDNLAGPVGSKIGRGSSAALDCGVGELGEYTAEKCHRWMRNGVQR
jgi:hypothetical protein